MRNVFPVIKESTYSDVIVPTGRCKPTFPVRLKMRAVDGLVMLAPVNGKGERFRHDCRVAAEEEARPRARTR
jgi:hypothetical protein